MKMIAVFKRMNVLEGDIGVLVDKVNNNEYPKGMSLSTRNEIRDFIMLKLEVLQEEYNYLLQQIENFEQTNSVIPFPKTYTNPRGYIVEFSNIEVGEVIVVSVIELSKEAAIKMAQEKVPENFIYSSIKEIKNGVLHTSKKDLQPML